ncbi:MAG: TlyA family RNA methyltransferase [Candidatus Paceibacterota bacterium]|jgi:23S rRNA (cytidine1920-2'-O)/16S rRNA (cytidine1409-2'-O)-methyltransferase
MKERIDVVIAKKKLAKSRTMAENLIKAGLVKVNEKRIFKPSTKVSEDDIIKIASLPKYVSRGGLKLEKALDVFEVDVKNLAVLDVGSATGGFTDCLLQRGARHIYAVDVGYGQLDQKLRKQSKVSVYEKTDIRNLKKLPEKVDLVTIDVSFISLLLVLPHIPKLLKHPGEIIALIKPQFEVGPGKVKKGIVRDEKLRTLAIEKIKRWISDRNWQIKGLIESPIKGKFGNIEYLIYLKINTDK